LGCRRRILVRERRSGEEHPDVFVDGIRAWFLRFGSDEETDWLCMVYQAVGMLFKRGSTISAAEGGCQAEVGGTFEVIYYLAFIDSS
jgi:hypothetical protein